MTFHPAPMLSAARAQRERLQGKLDGIVNGAQARGDRELTPAEARKFDKTARKIEQLDDEIRGFSRQEARFDKAAAASAKFGDFSVRGLDRVYARENGHSYFRDLALSSVPGPDSFEAVERLKEHARTIDRANSDLPEEFRYDPRKAVALPGQQEVRAGDRTDGLGGYFVPPLYLIDQYVAALRAGRTAADRCNRFPLPRGTDSINLPKVNQTTLTGVQGYDNAAVASQDLTDMQVTGPVRTIAGQFDLAQQLLDMSPIAFDQVVFQDLLADYNKRLDLQVLNGSGANGQITGILNVAGAGTATYTSGSPTVIGLYPVVGQSLSTVAKNRFKAADTILMHPSTWFWIASSLDGSNRPLVMPEGIASFNTMSIFDPNAAEGIAGSMAGTVVAVDANVPTNYGAGTNQAPIIVGKFDDANLYEGTIRMRSMPEVLSGTLSVRLQLWNYVAFIPNRYSQSWCILSGTGTIPQAGY